MCRTKRLLGVGLFSAVAAVFSAAAPQAQAGFTPVYPSVQAGEKTVQEVLQAVYGSGVIATRVDDTQDQVWSGSVLSTRALARFASFQQGLAFNDGSQKPQFNVTGGGLSVSGSAGAFTGSDFSIERTGPGGTFSSIDAKNSDGRDHMITYLIGTADKSSKLYAIFFEDMASPKGDFDFNDLGVEVKMASVPLPPAFWAGLTCLAGIGLMHRARRQTA